MASITVAETTSSYTTCHDDLDYTKFSNIDRSLIMSLLDDSQTEDRDDDEKLRSVIQSLEAELLNSESNLEEGYLDYDDQLSDIEQMNSCCRSLDRLDFDWIDVEMAYSSPVDDEIASYFITGFEGTKDDPRLIFHMMAIEEASAMQEAYESMVFG